MFTICTYTFHSDFLAGGTIRGEQTFGFWGSQRLGHVAQICCFLFVHFDGKAIRPDVVHVVQKISLQLCKSLNFNKVLDKSCQEQNYTNFIPCNCAIYTMRICLQKNRGRNPPRFTFVNHIHFYKSSFTFLPFPWIGSPRISFSEILKQPRKPRFSHSSQSP